MSEETRPEDAQFLTGRFLISETELSDPNFRETVVMLIEHNREGALGFVVNRKSNVSLGDLMEEFEEKSVRELPVYVGGPVEQRFMFVLHSGLPEDRRSDHAISPIPGVVFEPDFRIVARFLSDEWPKIDPQQRPSIHLYAGYSGWSAGQLESEIERKSWVILPATPELIFSANPGEAWREGLRKKGGIYWIAAETGYKPSFN